MRIPKLPVPAPTVPTASDDWLREYLRIANEMRFTNRDALDSPMRSFHSMTY